MVVYTNSDIRVLTPNGEHKNFTETANVIPSGTEMDGIFKTVQGMRRGEPFTYRVFMSDKGEIVYADSVSPKTNILPEIMSSADGGKTNYVPIIIGVGGALLGYFATRKLKQRIPYQPFVIAAGVGVASYYIYKKLKK